MGGINLKRNKSLSKLFPNFHPEDWVAVPINESEGKSRFGDFVTLRNKITKQQIDKYHITFYTEKQKRIYQDCFMQRLREQYLVNAFHYQPLQSNGMCSNVSSAIAYLQHIPIRLSDITDIPIDESIYILRSALYGFQKLFQQSGYFKVMEQLIGIDKEGHVRVWLNADVSKNYPYGSDDDGYQNSDGQKNMVKEIISLVQQNTSFAIKTANDNGSISASISPFSNYLQRQNVRNLSFPEAQHYIEQYSIKNQIEIPKHCNSIIQIFQEDYGQDFNLISDQSFSQNLDGGNQLFQNQQIGYSQHTQSQQSFHSRKSKASQASHQSKQNRLSRKSRQSVQNYNQNNLSLSNNSDRKFTMPLNKMNSSRESNQQAQGQSIHQGYKQYEPISVYRPNQRSGRISAQSGQNRGYIPTQIYSKRSQNSNEQGSLQGSRAGKSNRSQTSNSNFFVSNNNMNKVYIDSNKSQSPIIIPQPQIVRKMSSSQSQLSDQRSIRSNSNTPKVTFNYITPIPLNALSPHMTDRSIRSANERQQVNKIMRISQNSNQYSPQAEMELEFKNDLLNSLHQIYEGKQEMEFQKQHRDFSKKNQYYNEEKIDSDQSGLDPEIMRDLLKEFPDFDSQFSAH